MTKPQFIELTPKAEGGAFYVNINYLIAVFVDKRGNNVIRVTEGDLMDVKESPQEILKKIQELDK